MNIPKVLKVDGSSIGYMSFTITGIGRTCLQPLFPQSKTCRHSTFSSFLNRGTRPSFPKWSNWEHPRCFSSTFDNTHQCFHAFHGQKPRITVKTPRTKFPWMLVSNSSSYHPPQEELQTLQRLMRSCHLFAHGSTDDTSSAGVVAFSFCRCYCFRFI